MTNILIIDPQEQFSQQLRSLAGTGINVTCVGTIAEGLKEASQGAAEVIFLNSRMPDGNGIDLLPKILASPSHPEVIVITDTGDPAEAERAIKSGAWDYMVRPSHPDEIISTFQRIVQYRAQKTSYRASMGLKKETFINIIGNCPQMKLCMEVLAQAAHSEANVLITGETGTGKELLALAIHQNSPRASRNFVVVDCAALPETLVESTLFGHEKGAYTGAEKQQVGLIKQADGGTLFLDEVGELPLSVQSSFLRVLQERRFRPVGGSQEIRSNFRLIAASNRNLRELLKRGQFRQDLLFRLQTFTVELPPLRNRMDDIKYLAMYHMGEICARYGIRLKEFSDIFFEALRRYDWPGNVRELVNALERSIISARDEPILFPKHLPVYLRIHLAQLSAHGQPPPSRDDCNSAERTPGLPRLREWRRKKMAEMERGYFQELLALANGNIREALRISGVSRSRLYSLLKKHRFSPKNTFTEPLFPTQNQEPTRS